MSKSSRDRASERAVVIQRERELSEFVDLLGGLAVPVAVHQGEALPNPGDLAGTSVVVVCGRRLVEASPPNLSLWPRTLAVVDGSSRTLISHLQRLGVGMIIRRPIHARTLRLLLLHEIYRGPERRNRKRTLIGHPIRAGSGLFKQAATLLELSPTGARIEVANIPRVGSRLRLQIGKDLTLGKPLKLDVKVIRCLRPSGKNDRKGAEIGVALLDPRSNAGSINALLRRFAGGPAPWSGKQTQPSPASRVTPAEATVETLHANGCGATGVTVPDSDPSPRRLPPSRATCAEESESALPEPALRPAHDSTAAVEPEVAARQDSDRRSEPRIPYDRRVVALDEEAARVIVGRDLCHGGMRIDTSEAIRIGEPIRVALHSGTGDSPLVVLARAVREDADGSTVLAFETLSQRQSELMDRIIAADHPIHANLEADGDTDRDAHADGELDLALEIELEVDEGVDGEVDRDSRATSIVIGELLGTVGLDVGSEGSVLDAGEPVENSR